MDYGLLARHVIQAFIIGFLAVVVAAGTTNLTFGVAKAGVAAGVVAAARLLIEALSPAEQVKKAP